jgi:glycosyltransferase involved in cell wall biosynthesis
VRVLYRLLKQKKPHIAHTHAALSGRVAARLCGLKIVHTRHSVFPPVKRFLSGAVNNRLSDAMIAVSPAARDNLLAEGANESKITVIYNGMPPVRECNEQEKTELRKRYGVPPNAFTLAHIARLTAVKGQGYVLDAVKKLPGVYALLAGDGEDRAYLEKRIKDEQITNVKLLGFVDDIDGLVNSMDAQVNASFGTEATSLALIKGMSLGKPAVVTDYGGNPYVIEDGYNGLTVPCHNAEALAEAIQCLQNDGALYRRLSDGARQRYADVFTDRIMAEKTGALYEALLS